MRWMMQVGCHCTCHLGFKNVLRCYVLLLYGLVCFATDSNKEHPSAEHCFREYAQFVHCPGGDVHKTSSVVELVPHISNCML
jgi:hypothetical protein